MLILNTDCIQAVNTGEDIPRVLVVNGQRAIKVKWHSSSAWRGYYEATAVKKYGWEHLDDGWLTGDYPDAPEEARSSNVQDKIEKLAKELDNEGFDVLAVFVPTSNVFSTAYDVFKRKRLVLDKGRRIANNTRLYVGDGIKIVRLHSTDILVEQNGIITLNNGGWDTLTTRDRFNKYLPYPYAIVRYKGKTYLSSNGGWNDKSNWTLFENGMTVEGELRI